MPEPAVTRLVRRRGAWMIAIGAAHGLLLWAGDIVGAYGLLGVLMAGLLVRGTDRALTTTAAVGAVPTSLVYLGAALPPPPSEGMTALLPSLVTENPRQAALYRSL